MEPQDYLDVHVGVDVGGTNTDAVAVRDGQILGWSKQVTTRDVTSGVSRAIADALDKASHQGLKTGTCNLW